MSMRRRRTPWHRIYLAAESGTGCTLSADDVLRLGSDAAIMTRGEEDVRAWKAETKLRKRKAPV